MPYELCRHVMTTGRRCESPALKERFWCFFHDRLHTRHRFIREAENILPQTPLHIPSLEDHASIQVGISLVVEALATGRIDARRASVLLRGLQCAAQNAVHLRYMDQSEEVVRDFCPSLDGVAIAGRRMSDYSAPPPMPVPRHPGPDAALKPSDPVAPKVPDAVS